VADKVRGFALACKSEILPWRSHIGDLTTLVSHNGDLCGGTCRPWACCWNVLSEFRGSRGKIFG